MILNNLLITEIMNTAPDTPRKLPSPFAAVIDFKSENLFQNKHKSWIFRSDLIVPPNANAEYHYKSLENLLLKEFKGTFVCGTIFDNRKFEQERKKNLVLQVFYNQINIDRRKNLDLSFLTPSISQEFAEFITNDFAQPAEILQLPPLTAALREYKTNLQSWK